MYEGYGPLLLVPFGYVKIILFLRKQSKKVEGRKKINFLHDTAKIFWSIKVKTLLTAMTNSSQVHGRRKKKNVVSISKIFNFENFKWRKTELNNINSDHFSVQPNCMEPGVSWWYFRHAAQMLQLSFCYECLHRNLSR